MKRTRIGHRNRATASKTTYHAHALHATHHSMDWRATSLADEATGSLPPCIVTRLSLSLVYSTPHIQSSWYLTGFVAITIVLLEKPGMSPSSLAVDAM